ncbi:MAG: hypothetical protein HY360_00400 [Verrucomicrobia bacterium]|nr:hypothetical protein [Verrucomicrobiota bacterium]
MNSRERFQRIMRYEPVDRLPVLAIESYYEPTALERWRKEGLSPGQSPEDLLGMDAVRWTPVNFGPIPAFERRILSENERE